MLPIKDLSFKISPLNHQSGKLLWSYTNPSEVTHLQIIEKVENEERHYNTIDFFPNEIKKELNFSSAFDNDIRLYQIILHPSSKEVLVSHQISVDYSNYNLEEIQVSPNPTPDILSITGVSSKSIEFRIIGMDGQEYQSGFLHTTDYEYNLDCRNLPVGVYLLQIDGVFKKFTKI